MIYGAYPVPAGTCGIVYDRPREDGPMFFQVNRAVLSVYALKIS